MSDMYLSSDKNRERIFSAPFVGKLGRRRVSHLMILMYLIKFTPSQLAILEVEALQKEVLRFSY